MKQIIAFILVLINLFLLNGQNIQFTASAPKVVESGEQFQLTYSINAEPSGFKPPVFNNFTFLGGPSTSNNSSIQIVNGKVSQNKTVTYAYFLQAANAGTFTIEPAKATVDGKSYTSNPVSIEVVASGNAKQNQNQNTQKNKPGATTQNKTDNVPADVGDENLFVRVIVDKSSVYQGEAIVATVKIYTKLNLSSASVTELPEYGGFFKQDIDIPQPKLERENLNGVIYGTAVFSKVLLFPQKSGEITINPATSECVVQQQSKKRAQSIFDDFWGPQYTEVKKTIKSKPVKITVKPLPANSPSSFNGAVGNMSFKATLDKNKVKTNDAISLKIAISGSGNMKLIESLKPDFPPDFEVYDPKISLNIKNSPSGSIGSKTFEYLIIPRHSGDFTIPPVEFSYFDIPTKKYKKYTSDEFKISVAKSGDEDKNPAVISGLSKEDIKFIGKDIRFIKQGKEKLRLKNDLLFGSSLFYSIYAGSFLLFMFIILFWRKKIQEAANIVRVKNKRANKIARMRLKSASVFLKNKDTVHFYDELLQAIWGYMSDKLAIPVSELSRDKAMEMLVKFNIDEELKNKFIELLDSCEFARYAPSAVHHEMDITYQKAVDIISKLEQKIR